MDSFELNELREECWKQAIEMTLRKWSNVSEENKGVAFENVMSNLRAAYKLKQIKSQKLNDKTPCTHNGNCVKCDGCYDSNS